VRRRSGYTLIELLFYVAMWTTISATLMGFMHTVLSTISRGAEPVLLQKQLEMVTDRIRLDITNSRRALGSFENWKTGEDALVLEAEENGETLILVHLREGARWRRIEVQPGKKPEEAGSASLELSRMDFKIIPVEGTEKLAVLGEIEAECGWGKTAKVHLGTCFTSFPRGGNGK